MAVASSDEVTLVIDARDVVAEGFRVLVDVIDVVENSGDGCGRSEVAAEGWYMLPPGGINVGGALEGHVELVGVVEGGVEAFGPGVCST